MTLMASAMCNQKEPVMKTNVGGIDKVLRIIARLALLVLLFIIEGSEPWWVLVGIMPLRTGTLGWCPAYTLVGLNTCPAKQ